jgi:GTP-binding protein HflX
MVVVSARTGEGLEGLLKAIDGALFTDPVVTVELEVPQQEGGVLAALEAGAVIEERSYVGELVRLRVSGPASLMGRLRAYRVRNAVQG